MTACAFPGCGAKRGGGHLLCYGHCAQKRRGHALTPIARPTLEERFWALVNKTGPTVRPELGPCWEWIGSISASPRSRYGGVRRDGRTLLAHRHSWELANGPITGGLFVLHRCDNQRCVRPDHLFLGTQTENVHDAQAKGRRRIRSAA